MLRIKKIMLGPTVGLLFRKPFFLYRSSEAGNVKYCYELHAKSGLRFMNTASELGPHTQTDRGTCPGVGL
jgi:hypothetical protein